MWEKRSSMLSNLPFHPGSSPPQANKNKPCLLFSPIHLSCLTILFSLPLFAAARWEQTHPGATVQLEGRYKAQGQHLHRRQSRVRVCPLHSLFPHLAQWACQSPVQFLWCRDCLSPLQPKAHRHHLPCAPQVQETLNSDLARFQLDISSPALELYIQSVTGIVVVFLL